MLSLQVGMNKNNREMEPTLEKGRGKENPSADIYGPNQFHYFYYWRIQICPVHNFFSFQNCQNSWKIIEHRWYFELGGLYVYNSL